MKELQVIKGIECFEDENGIVQLNLEQIAKGLGFVQFKNKVEYVRWDRVNGYLESFGFSPQVGKEKFIPEPIFYMLAMKAENEAAKCFQKIVAYEILPAIRKTGGYLGANEDMTDEEIMAKALMVAQKTIQKKDELIKIKEKELLGVKEDLNIKNKFINQIAVSENSLLVREVAKIASKQGIVIGEKRLWSKLRKWGFIFKNSTEAKQDGIDRGYFEIVEGSKTNKDKTFTYHTTRVTGKGQVYIIKRLLNEMGCN